MKKINTKEGLDTMAEEKTGGKPSTKAKNKYNAKAYDQFLVTVPTGEKAEIDRVAKEQGYNSRNEFVVAAINEKKKRN
jgi:hypothetical protein